MRSIFAATAVAFLGVVGFAVPALAFDPTGLWMPDNRESRYEIAYCDASGEMLCARLVWVREDVQDERNMRYLNEYMFRNARQTAPDVWRGTVSLEGFNIGGTLTQTAEDQLRVEACVLFVICETIAMRRVQ